jgi:hypothetical protein
MKIVKFRGMVENGLKNPQMGGVEDSYYNWRNSGA